jgi:SAM-dependent methyltransferase
MDPDRTVAMDARLVASHLDIEHTEQKRNGFMLWHQPVFDEDRRKQRVLFDALIENTKGKKVLEIGYPHPGRCVPHAKVMDLYDPRPDVDYRMDACDMRGIRANTFDWIVAISLLEHIPKFWLATAEMQRVLKPGGLIWVGVPTVWPHHPESVDGKTFYGGDYWRMNHSALTILFDRCDKIACWYIAALAKVGDDPHSGWGAAYLGEKVR